MEFWVKKVVETILITYLVFSVFPATIHCLREYPDQAEGLAQDHTAWNPPWHHSYGWPYNSQYFP